MRLLSFFALFLLLACQNESQKAELLIFNGPIYTVDSSQAQVEALAVANGKIIALGNWSNIQKFQSPNTELLDLKGKTLIPAFIESHAHILGLGQFKRELDLSQVKSYEELIQLVQEQAEKTPKGEWILGRAWHQSKWDSLPFSIKGYQTHDALSQAVPDHPVLLMHASAHALMANEKAMQLAGLTPETQMNEEGEIIRFPNGRPTGIFTENAMSMIKQALPPADENSRYQDLQAGIQEALSYGIGSLQDAGSDSAAIALYRKALAQNELPLRLWVMLAYNNYAADVQGQDDPFLEKWLKKGPEKGDFLSIGGIKLYADGALGSRGAWMIEEYSDRAGHFGHPTLPLKTIEEIAEKALLANFQLCTHAIGDRANQELLNIYERVLKAQPQAAKDHRFRIEHAQHIAPQDIPRFAELDVIASVQGIHFSSDRPWAQSRLGRLRIAMNAYRWKQLLDSGAKLINGTDAPVESINPIACFYSLVSRQANDGQVYEADQKLSRLQALKAYTLDAAYGAFQEKEKGSLEVGKFADFAILSQDIMQVPLQDIPQTKVLQTIVDGKTVYLKE